MAETSSALKLNRWYGNASHCLKCRRAARPKKIWDKIDDQEWKHDKFNLDSDEDDYMVMKFCLKSRITMSYNLQSPHNILRG